MSELYLKDIVIEPHNGTVKMDAVFMKTFLLFQEQRIKTD